MFCRNLYFIIADRDADHSPWTKSRYIVGRLTQSLKAANLPVHPILQKFALVTLPKPPQSPIKSSQPSNMAVGTKSIKSATKASPAAGDKSKNTISPAKTSVENKIDISTAKTPSATDAPLPKRLPRDKNARIPDVKVNVSTKAMSSKPETSNGTSGHEATKAIISRDSPVKGKK